MPCREISLTAGCPIAAASSSSVQRASRFSSPAPDRRPRTPTGPIRRACPRISRGRRDDPDNDGLVNLLEFVLARDPLQTNVSGIIATTVVVDGQRFPAVTFVRRLDLGGVTFGVLTSADLAFASLLGVEQVSATAIDVGLEQVVIRSAGAARPAAESVLPARGDAADRAGGDHRHVVTGRRHEPAHGSRTLRPRRAADFRGSLRRRGRFEHRDQPGVLRRPMAVSAACSRPPASTTSRSSPVRSPVSASTWTPRRPWRPMMRR